MIDKIILYYNLEFKINDFKYQVKIINLFLFKYKIMYIKKLRLI